MPCWGWTTEVERQPLIVSLWDCGLGSTKSFRDDLKGARLGLCLLWRRSNVDLVCDAQR